MGGKPSRSPATGLLQNIQGAQIQILNVDPNVIMKYLLTKTVPQQDASSISKDIAQKSINEIAGILGLIPGLEQFGGVIGVISGLVDLLSSNYQNSFNSIIQGMIGQALFIDHYSTIKGNLDKITINIGIQKLDQACQDALDTLTQVQVRMQNGSLEKWYTSMGNKISLQLLALYYKVIVQTAQIFNQVLQQLTPQDKQKYQTFLQNYLDLLNNLKNDIVQYRATLMSIRVYIQPTPRPQDYWKTSTIEDKGQDASQSYTGYHQLGDFTSQFNDFKTKSINQAKKDLDSIVII